MGNWEETEDWILKLFKQELWEAIITSIEDKITSTEDKIEKELKNLKNKVGKEPLATSPLVRVIEYDQVKDYITFLLRGPFELKGVGSVFMRVEVVISTDIDLSDDFPLKVVEWRTIIGDLKIIKKDVFIANLAFGYDNGVWSGRGALKILPAGFGLDIALGGLSERGVMIGLNVDLPAPIPLGSSGLGLAGMGGDFAYNFIARLEEDGLPISNPTAKSYVKWARDVEVPDRWKQGPIEETAVGLGINTDLITLADNGYVIKLEPIGFAVLTPGPIFVLGGVGKLLNANSALIEGYVVVDIESKSMALGLEAQIDYPALGDFAIANIQGIMDSFFSFQEPSAWYINLGTDKKPITAKGRIPLTAKDRFAPGWFDMKMYLMINDYQLSLGASISIGREYELLKWKKKKIISLTGKLGADVAATIGRNPVRVKGIFQIWGELGLKAWGIKFILSLLTRVEGSTSDPTKLDLTIKYKLSLPWAIPDIKGEKILSLGEENPPSPIVASPLMAGKATIDDQVSSKGPMKLGMLHALTGRQWSVGPESRGWPDIEIVVPFSTRVIDMTETVTGCVVSATIEGGYKVEHQLKELRLVSIADDGSSVQVPDLQAIWTAGPGGNTARLHVMGQDPFSWVIPHFDTFNTITETPGKTVEQLFGYGMSEVFVTERLFGEMFVDPLYSESDSEAELITYFQPALLTRILRIKRGKKFKLYFRTSIGEPIHVDQITLYLLKTQDMEIKKVKVEVFKDQNPESQFSATDVIKSVYNFDIVGLTIPLSPANDELVLKFKGDLDLPYPLLVYAVHYHEARQPNGAWHSKTVLKPGKYEISLYGESSATHQGGELPSSKITKWSVKDSFQINYPETLRPYILDTTIGDSRIFSDEKLSWNPTMYGFGFPIYQKYQGVVHFSVPYMSKIFSTIKFRLTYETGEAVEQNLTPMANESEEVSLPDKVRTWTRQYGGTVEPDQVIILSNPFPNHGPAGICLLFDDPDGKEVKLDEWTCYISQFDSFKQHIEWNCPCLTIFYGSTGRTECTYCQPLINDISVYTQHSANRGNRIDPIAMEKPQPNGDNTSRFSMLNCIYPINDEAYPIDNNASFPEELTTPPVNWYLPLSMTKWLQPLDDATSYRFVCFASETGACFNVIGSEKLDGINDIVDNTTIEAVIDDQGRPYALWLRTPEPVDWRRVKATLRIRHIKQYDNCSATYERRNPLNLSVEILPSPDASSAFLISSLAGYRTRLPRGEYELNLIFDTKFPNLPRLYPKPEVENTPEQVLLKFIQPSGENWPLTLGNDTSEGGLA